MMMGRVRKRPVMTGIALVVAVVGVSILCRFEAEIWRVYDRHWERMEEDCRRCDRCLVRGLWLHDCDQCRQ